MKFKLDFEISKREVLSDFCAVSLLGSCFAVNQAESFKAAGFKTWSNPYGILYNPISISRLLHRIQHNLYYKEDDFTASEGRYFSLEHHGSCSYKSASEAVKNSNQILVDFKNHLELSQLLVLSFGTSLVFKYKASSTIVGNCHRLPAEQFEHIQLSLEECEEAFKQIYSSIEAVNSKLQIVATISPIRHLRSGVLANNVSKSTLRVALDRSPLKSYYFPSFEIFIDELRDYRFSKEDFSHPTSQAQSYIWERFKETFMSHDLLLALKEVANFRRFQSHKARTDQEAHDAQIRSKVEEIKRQYSNVQLD